MPPIDPVARARDLTRVRDPVHRIDRGHALDGGKPALHGDADPRVERTHEVFRGVDLEP